MTALNLHPVTGELATATAVLVPVVSDDFVCMS